MSSLIKIRAERDQMSAIERRIADFILENAHLLRDYSSQQLANSLRISQSSVVKFSQKLGFKGYPDLKVSVSEAVARENGNGESRAAPPSRSDPQTALAADLWRSKSLARKKPGSSIRRRRSPRLRAPSTRRARFLSSVWVRTACLLALSPRSWRCWVFR